MTHPELSDLHGISKQALLNLLSVTLLPSINLKRPELRNWRGCGGAARRLKLGELEDEYVAAEEALDDPALALAERNKLRNLKRQLIRDMNEMCEHLLTRTAVAVESPLPLRHEVLDSTGRSGVIS